MWTHCKLHSSGPFPLNSLYFSRSPFRASSCANSWRKSTAMTQRKSTVMSSSLCVCVFFFSHAPFLQQKLALALQLQSVLCWFSGEKPRSDRPPAVGKSRGTNWKCRGLRRSCRKMGESYWPLAMTHERSSGSLGHIVKHPVRRLWSNRMIFFFLASFSGLLFFFLASFSGL